MALASTVDSQMLHSSTSYLGKLTAAKLLNSVVIKLLAVLKFNLLQVNLI
jgi:hypothetical protein